ncbi:MAG TPA: metal-sensitive transcriptional regulator, partial [Rhizomicrobium sp.]|nr:metal-sensitive transcriptional regulator [Rhizomicrobium sp.]
MKLFPFGSGRNMSGDHTMLGCNAMPHRDPKLISRLSRIEGQVRGVARMVEEERYCIDVLDQVQAIKAALKKVEEQILKDHS